MNLSQRSSWLAFVVMLALAGFALWPGTRGGFVFDDYPNLVHLGDYGRVDSWPVFARYVTSGSADPLGRPVAVASFLLDARDWPADPFPFKRTNIALHLLNGLLLFLVLAELGRAGGNDERSACRAAALAAGLWMLHPLFLSTTLYIVQREAMLPATFTFLALWLWMASRRRLLDGHARARAWMVLTVLSCTVLATLSKANGLLLPALLLLVECALARWQDSKNLRGLRRWLLWPPTALLCAAMLLALPGYIRDTPISRGWTLGQRLLTESRVLFDYLDLLWLPRPLSPGLFNDDIPVSHDLLHPWTTLPAVLGVLALAIIAWRARQRAPALSMAVGFYLVGQSMESGPVPLELYYEHRNYLPAALMFWPLALWLTHASPSLPRLRDTIAVLLPLLLAGMTWLGAGVWGDPARQALVWGERNPDSPRAQAYLAQFEIAQGRLAQAEVRLRTLLRTRPLDPQLVVNLIDVRCKSGGLSAGDLAASVHAFATNPDPTRLSVHWLQTQLPMVQAGTCPGLGLPEAERLARAFAGNPRTQKVPGQRSDAWHLLGQLALAAGHPDEALRDFNAAYAAEARADTVLVQAALLAAAHQPRLALEHLQRATVPPAKPLWRWRSMADAHGWVLYRQGFWQRQIAQLRGRIRADLPAVPVQPLPANPP